MSNQEILEKSIQKALDRSWDMFDYDKWQWSVEGEEGTSNNWYRIHLWIEDTSDRFEIDAERIIFDHEFAKALWGNKVALDYFEWSEEQFTDELWKFHLINMVIANDPIKYLGENI